MASQGEAAAHIQNKVFEEEVTTRMVREHTPISPSKVGFYDRSKTVIIRGLTASNSTVHSERTQHDLH